jgi:glycosyltransferase involved in cell wall biosynthesis
VLPSNSPHDAAPVTAPTVLILSDYYLPGFKAGGPIRTLANMVERLGSELSIRLITRDRDYGDRKPYPGIRADGWQSVGSVQIAYERSAVLHPLRLRRLIAEAPHDVLYLNSLFSPPFTIQALLLRSLGLIPRVRTVLAPRGELAHAAFARKHLKKRVFLAVARILGLYRDIVWQACSEHEAADIRRVFGSGATIVVAPDLSADEVDDHPGERRRLKEPGTLRLVYLSRVVPHKNLRGAIEMLGALRGPVEMDVYGPLQDAVYWRNCQELASHLPEGVAVRYQGVARPEEVPQLLADYDLLLFPTRGESFGHVVLEALLAGVPVLISDRTPWRGLEGTGAGWDLPLDRPAEWLAALERCRTWDEASWSEWSARARRAGCEYARDADVLSTNLELLRAGTGARPSAAHAAA